MRSGFTNALSKAVFALVALLVTDAAAVPNGGDVKGRITLPAAGLGDTPALNQGFLERERYPLRKPRAFDPRGQMVVVLEGGKVARVDKKPSKRPVPYRLVGESFETSIIAVVAGSEVELKNRTKHSPELYSPTNTALIPAERAVFNPDATRLLKKLSDPYTQYEIRARDSAHLRGRILALPNNYFAVANEDGSFSISGVPSGTWTVRVWYDGGWVKTQKTTVTVRPKIAADVVVRLPAKLEVEKPGKGN